MYENDTVPTIGGEAETNPADVLKRLGGILVHRRWWFLITLTVVVLSSIAILSRTRNRYTSEATIVVTQQQVPERYVVPTSTTNLTKDLETMEGEVLSRTRLFSLIDEFGLYAKERKRLAPEQLLHLMMSNIKVEPLAGSSSQKEADSFRVSFTTDDPVLAQSVTSRLASMFILNNVKGREDQAVNTTNFLRVQLDASQKKLSDLEQNLRDFKMQHLGELPEQQAGNLAILSGLQTQLQNTTSSIARAEQQRVYLQSLLNTLHGPTAATGAPKTASAQNDAREPGPSDEAILGAELRLTRLRNEKKTLTELRGPDDADVRKLNVDIARTDALLQTLRAARPQGPAVSAPESDDPSTAQFKSQLEANRVELENLARDERQIKQTIAQYQNRLNMTPVREQQLSGLLRDIELVQKQYADLLTKEQQSQLASNLEQQQGGQQFRLLEPPSLPTIPSSPKRTQLGAVAGLAGVVAGVLAAFLADVRYRAFYADTEVIENCKMPLVIGIPLFMTEREKRKRIWRMGFEWAAGFALTLVICGAELAYLRAWNPFV